MSKKSQYWRPYPLTFSVMNIVERREGMLLEDDLVRLLENDIGDVSKRELNEALMKLEVEGLIYVQTIKKNQRMIKQIDRKAKYLAIGED